MLRGYNLAESTWCVTHGRSGHAWFNILDVPYLRAPTLLASLTSLTVPLSYTWVIHLGLNHGLAPCLRFAPALTASTTCTLYVCGVCLAFSCLLFWRISFCLPSFINCQFAWDEAFSIVSWPLTNCEGHARKVVCTVEFIVFRHAANMPWNPKDESRSIISLICALQIMLWSVLWHLSTMKFNWGFLLVTILRLMPFCWHKFLPYLCSKLCRSVQSNFCRPWILQFLLSPHSVSVSDTLTSSWRIAFRSHECIKAKGEQPKVLHASSEIIP